MRKRITSRLLILVTLLFLMGGMFIKPVVSANSEPEWVRTWGGDGYESASRFAFGAYGDIYVSGTSGPSLNHQNNDMLLAKFNSSGHYKGNQTWDIDGRSDIGQAIAIDSNNNIIIAGNTVDMTNHCIVKYDYLGTYQWNMTYNQTGIEGEVWIGGVDTDFSNNIYVAGSTGGVDREVFLLKISPEGVLLWKSNYISYYHDDNIGATDLTLNSLGDIWVAAYSASQLLLVQFDSLGDVQRGFPTLIIRDIENIKGLSIITDTSNNIYVAGSSTKVIFVEKYDSSGDSVWLKTLGKNLKGEGYGLALDSQRNVYVAGYTGDDLFVLKYDKDGTYLGYGLYGEENRDYFARDIMIDGSDNVYVLGGTNSSSGDYEIVLAKNIVITAPSSDSIAGYHIVFILAIVSLSVALIWNKCKLKCVISY